MKLLRYVLTLVLVVAVASPLLAGEGKKGKKGAKPKAPPVFGPARILEGLTLTADQKEQVEKIRKEFEPKLEELRKKGMTIIGPKEGLDLEAFRTQVMAHVNAKFGAQYGKIYEEIRAILK